MEKEQLNFLRLTSQLTDGNIAYIEDLYDRYLKDKASVSPEWSEYFSALPAAHRQESGNGDIALSEIRARFLALNKQPAAAVAISPDIGEMLAIHQKQMRVYQLINAYRCLGHQHARLDPLDLAERKRVPDLSLTHYGFTDADLNLEFDAERLLGSRPATLRAIHAALERTYCDTLGVEFMHITDQQQVTWIQERLESVQSHPEFSADEKRNILLQLTRGEGLERYLGARYVGQTRFSLEGGVSLMPMMDELVQRAGRESVKELIIGMGHRGRLNVLVNTLGKPIEVLFKEFEGKTVKANYSGDVKYHDGYSCNFETSGGIIHLALAFNPSHLEIIDPVVEGAVRARQERRGDEKRQEVIPVLIHGDAAFAGQGIVMETFCLSQARGFCTGGTIHVVVNNQIGFTTSNPEDARSSEYCTDIGKMVQTPVFHVNGDDPEAVVFAMQVAFDYRMKFNSDVIIDLVCYRRHGHNEADEPLSNTTGHV